MLYAYLVIRNIFRISVQELQAVKINSLEVYNKNLGTMYDNVRGFKHDFSNFVIALNGYVRDKNIDGIDKMSTSILKDCKDVNNLEILDPKSIGNPAIYSIITNKYNLAKENGIKVNLDILTDLKQSTEKSYAICRILGILLDNAIEAAKETDEKKMNVKFLDDNKFDRKLIIIENSYNNKDVNVDKIFEKGYTSKDDNSNSHGLGLWNIKSILENNEGLNLYTRKGDLFKQQLEIYTKF
jgi:two-component system sensor histidine kinase AgrC